MLYSWMFAVRRIVMAVNRSREGTGGCSQVVYLSVHLLKEDATNCELIQVFERGGVCSPGGSSEEVQ